MADKSKLVFNLSALSPKKDFIALAIIALFCGLNSAKAGVESAQLDYVALDSNVECNRILFQSSQHFKKTLFSIPRVVVGTGLENTRPYNISPTAQPGIYSLAVNLYFPSNDEVLKTSAASSFKKDLYACNWDKVKNSLNKNILNPSDKIQTISRIPLTSIEVQIRGIKDVGRIGRVFATSEESDILDYYGKSLTAYFNISDAEKNIFESQLVSTEGISASVKFRFQARSRNGSVHATVDLKNLAMNFSAAASAKGLKYLASGDLSATLKSSMTENTIRIDSESGAGTREDVSKITNMLVDKILKEVDFSMTAVKLVDEDRAKLGSGQISVAAIAEILKTKASTEVTFNLVTAPETATAQTEVKLKTDRLNDPNVIEVTVSAGYTDPSLGSQVLAGQSLSITPAYWFLDKIQYKESRNYLTTGEIQNLNLASYFDDLLNESMSVKDVEINNTLLAEGRWTPLNGRSPLSSPNKFRWARVTQSASRFRDSSNNIAPTFEALSSLPIYLTFSELGDRRFIKLSELIEENPFWSAIYDSSTGRLILTAKQNLGTIRVRERMHGEDSLKYASKPIILEQIFQQKINLFGNSEYVSHYIMNQDPKAIVLQKSITLYITRPRIMNESELQYLKDKVKLEKLQSLSLKPR